MSFKKRAAIENTLVQTFFGADGYTEDGADTNPTVSTFCHTMMTYAWVAAAKRVRRAQSIKHPNVVSKLERALQS